MIDVVHLLGPGWKVDSSEVVTASNQMEFSTDLPDACELKQLATEVKSAWGGYPSYAPPIGWTVYEVSKLAGYSSEPLSVEDTIWASSEGVAYSVTSCAKGVMGGEAVKVIVSEKKTKHTWLLLGALGALAWLTFKE
jgi:hypothetical protein